MKMDLQNLASFFRRAFQSADCHPSPEMLAHIAKHRRQEDLRTSRTNAITHLQSDGSRKTFPIRTLLSWKGRMLNDPLDQDDGEDQSYGRYLDLTDGVCALLCLSPTFNAAVRSTPALEKYTLGFAPISIKTFGTFSPRDSQNVKLADHMIDRDDGPAGKDGEKIIPWITAHEIRHGVQYIKGPFFPGTLNIHDAILNGRISEADSCAFQTTVAWELQQRGHDAPWRSLWDRAKYGAIAKAFYECARRDDGAVNSGIAANAAFRTWFADRKLRGIYERGECKPVVAHLKMLADHWQEANPDSRVLEECRLLEDHTWRAVLKSRSAMPFLDKAGKMVERPHYLNQAIVAATLAPSSRSVTDKRPLHRIEGLTETLRGMATEVSTVMPEVHLSRG